MAKRNKRNIQRIFFRGMSLLFIILITTTCSYRKPVSIAEEAGMKKRPLEDVLKDHAGNLMSLHGVVGTAQGLCKGDPCIKVFVIKKTSDVEKNIPRHIEGYIVAVEETGEIKALPDDRD